MSDEEQDAGRYEEHDAGREEEQDVERMLTEAFQPVDPPPRLSDRIESTLSAVTLAAATELGEWADELGDRELGSLRNPRHWVRPVAALTAGGLATGALVALELRRRARGDRGIRGRLS